MKNWFRYWWDSKKCNLPLFWNQQLISEAAISTHRQGKPGKAQSRELFTENSSLLSQQKCNAAWGKWAGANTLWVLLKGLDRRTGRWATLKFHIWMQEPWRPESGLKSWLEGPQAYQVWWQRCQSLTEGRGSKRQRRTVKPVYNCWGTENLMGR